MDNKNIEIDYSQYGVFDGKPFIPFYNREQRRKYKRRFKKSHWYCPHDDCGVQVVFDDVGAMCCTLCGKILGRLKSKDSNG